MEYRRALFIRFGGIGDILLATPSVRALRDAFPRIEIDFIVGGGMVDALAQHELIREVIVFDKRGVDSRLDHFVPFLRHISRANYDLVINLHPSAKSHLISSASGARRRLVFRKDMTVDPNTGRITHAIDDFAKALQPIGITEVDDALDFTIPDDARRSVDELLRFSGVAPSARLIVINPAASRPVNRWPKERFQAVASHYASQLGTSVIVTGAPRTFRTEMDKIDEIDLAAEVASVDPRIVSVAGKLTVKELGALLARSAAFLTCDTGPMHVGAAVNAPMVVLSGAADPDRTGPRTRNAIVLIDRGLPCIPCRARACARGDLRCMQNIAVEDAVDAIDVHLLTQKRELRRVLPVIPK